MTEATEAADKKPKYTRVPSAIQFPYTDMSDAVAVAEGLLKGGGVPMSRDQLAAAMALAPGGGGFAKKLSTAGMFGVLDVAAGKYQLTELGFEIVDSGRQQDAKARAFLNVELYRRTYEEFRGKLLPTRPHGLEAAFISFGVSPKNVKDARRAFEKSARMAGFFPNSTEDRLVMPFGASASAQEEPEEPVVAKAAPLGTMRATTAGGSMPIAYASGPVGLHRSIMGWLEELPEPGSEWGKEAQADWLQALATMFKTIYKNDDKGKIEIAYRESQQAP